MLVLLSPAKKVLNAWQPFTSKTTTPRFLGNSKVLVDIMKGKSVSDIAHLMDLSNDLATLNYDRYQHMDLEHQDLNQLYPAVLLFQGDVYQGLKASTMSESTLDYAQQHLGILSGLFGLLRPLDLIAPYRLEMGTRLENPKGKSLYDFWRDILAEAINLQLKDDKHPVVINLASSEYFSAVDLKRLKYPVLTINFYEQKNGQLKMIGIHAKKARGTMARYLMEHRINTIDGIQNFDELGYRFNPETSSDMHLDFVRA